MLNFLKRVIYSFVVAPVMIISTILVFIIQKLVEFIPGWIMWIITGKTDIKFNWTMNFIALHDWVYWNTFVDDTNYNSPREAIEASHGEDINSMYPNMTEKGDDHE